MKLTVKYSHLLCRLDSALKYMLRDVVLVRETMTSRTADSPAMS